MLDALVVFLATRTPLQLLVTVLAFLLIAVTAATEYRVHGPVPAIGLTILYVILFCIGAALGARDK